MLNEGSGGKVRKGKRNRVLKCIKTGLTVTSVSVEEKVNPKGEDVLDEESYSVCQFCF